MAIKPVYTDLDFQEVGQLLKVRLHNVTDAEMTTLGGGLGAQHKGLTVWNTDQDRQFNWNGTQFQADAIDVAGDVIFRGVLGVADYDQNDAGYTTGPSNTESGSQYVISEAGTIDLAGVTVQPNASVEVGDIVLFVSPTEIFVSQRNDVAASTTVAGNIKLADQAAVDAGVEGDTAVTPATLQGKLDSEQYVKLYTETINTTGLTKYTVTHNLGLINKDAFVVNVMLNGNQISADVESVDVNSITVETFLSLTGVVVTICGASSV